MRALDLSSLALHTIPYTLSTHQTVITRPDSPVFMARAGNALHVTNKFLWQDPGNEAVTVASDGFGKEV